MNPQEVTQIWQRIIALENKVSGYDIAFKSHFDEIQALKKSHADLFNKFKVLLADNFAIEKKVDLKKELQPKPVYPPMFKWW